MSIMKDDSGPGLGAWIGGGAAVVGVLIALSWVFTGNAFSLYAFWAPKQAQVERDVFKNTEAYISGNVQDFYKDQAEYSQATSDAARSAIAGSVLHRAAAFPWDKLPPDLQAFVSKLRAQQLQPQPKANQ